ncbi:thymidylate synthase [Methanobrevibacter arboriphilus JCM 13429 = DSM 1125]|uniref:Putative thymidylate synthase n=1 Tax=Methanobrevibacter arboriphilus JCM 13429 = DSM 1125 TaxID=1300164 RepID=A0A1V6N2K3_METAZ|nr:thymidylate synthase [Methanobrevibacter arboriphilus]OQD58793.1 thymidylate synthase [Methanobrevibacter arboriphilus JCM 13429 = DSM 1125]
MPILIEVDEIADGWETLVKEIMKNGKDVNDERGSLTKEILNVMVSIKKPFGKDAGGDFFNIQSNSHDISNIRVPEGYFWKGDRLKTYSEQFISDDKQGFVYTYGNRLRAHFGGVDQINEAIERLKNCRESRRAISITWDQVVDSKNDEVPCMILVDFKIRDDKLYTTALWRSHDIYGAWFPNAVGLSYLAQYVSERVDASIETITIHSISAHIYEVNFKEARELL